MLNPYFVSGFVDGEGTFSITLTPRKKMSIEWEIRPSFSVSQNKLSKGILFKLKDFFGCGYIRPSKKDNMYKYEIRSLPDLSKKVVPHFQKFQLHTTKRKDFQIFEQIIKLVEQKKHLNREGFKDILILLDRLNPRAKKIYNRKKLRELMNV